MSYLHPHTPQANMQIHQSKEYLLGHIKISNNQVSKAQHITSNNALWHPLNSICAGQSLLTCCTSSQTKKWVLPLFVRGRESTVLTQSTGMANTSKSRLAHVPHLPLILRLPRQQDWRRTEVVLKWDEDRPGWLNVGIRGITASNKTEKNLSICDDQGVQD